MKRWRREALITAISYAIIGLCLAPVLPGSTKLWNVLMVGGAICALLMIVFKNVILGKAAAMMFVSASVLRACAFLFNIWPPTLLSNEELLAAATIWFLLSYEVGSVWVRVIVPGLKVELKMGEMNG